MKAWLGKPPQTADHSGQCDGLMGSAIPHAGDGLHQFLIALHGLRRDTPGNIIYIYAYFVEQPRASSHPPREDATDLRLARRNGFCYVFLGQSSRSRSLRKSYGLKPDLRPAHALIMHFCILCASTYVNNMR